MGEYISSHIIKKHRKGAICKQAYTECGKYLSRRLLLTKRVLRIFSSVDPRARGGIACQLLKKLIHVLYLNLTLNELT